MQVKDSQAWETEKKDLDSRGQKWLSDEAEDLATQIEAKMADGMSFDDAAVSSPRTSNTGACVMLLVRHWKRGNELYRWYWGNMRFIKE